LAARADAGEARTAPRGRRPRLDRHTKKALYARFGVPHYWIVDPELRLLEAYTLQSSGLWLETGIYDETSRARIAPFDAIELDLANVFPPASDGAPPAG
jgi:Uma2 family endonuclease